MPRNSLEQLCINFANEKLHQQFIGHVFKEEMKEYEKEDMSISVPFEDNVGCVEMIEHNNTGVFAALKEQCTLGTRGSDKNFIEKMGATLEGSFFARARLNPSEFVVKHYAGHVTYNSEGFLEKNRDTLNSDIRVLLGLCPAPAALEFYLAAGLTNTEAKAGTKLVCHQFKDHLATLVAKLSVTTRHYVRCIKSNEAKLPHQLDGPMVTRQLTYSGVLETVMVRKEGFSVRIEAASFTERFGVIADGKDNHKHCSARKSMVQRHKDLVATVMDVAGVSEDMWALGKVGEMRNDDAFHLTVYFHLYGRKGPVSPSCPVR
jgi:myosin heavy subunit